MHTTHTTRTTLITRMRAQRGPLFALAAMAALLAAMLLAPRGAQASDGTITVNGQITANTCTINSGTPNLTVTLPTVSTVALPSGSVAGATAVTMSYSGCSAGLTSATVYFEAGANVDYSTGCLKNTATTGASNVEVCFANTAGTAIDLGKPSGSQGMTAATLSSGAGTGTFLVRYAAATAAATAGTYTSQVTYSVVYQ